MGSLGRRLARLEQQSSVVQPCRWCEQAYWTMVADNPAIGLYCETEYGSEVSRVAMRAYDDLFRECGYEVRDRHHRDDLPTYDLDQTEEHQGVMAAWALVVESRPPREGCQCYGARAVLRNIEARVLCYYPRVAEALIEALEHYAASPLETRALYHWPMGNEACVCTPSNSGGGLPGGRGGEG